MRNVAGSWAVLSAQWGPGGARALQPPPAACSVLDCPVPGQTASPRGPPATMSLLQPAAMAGNAVC